MVLCSHHMAGAFHRRFRCPTRRLAPPLWAQRCALRCWWPSEFLGHGRRSNAAQFGGCGCQAPTRRRRWLRRRQWKCFKWMGLEWLDGLGWIDMWFSQTPDPRCLEGDHQDAGYGCLWDLMGPRFLLGDNPTLRWTIRFQVLCQDLSPKGFRRHIATTNRWH